MAIPVAPPSDKRCLLHHRIQSSSSLLTPPKNAEVATGTEKLILIHEKNQIHELDLMSLVAIKD
ncbi:hypothetical protein E2562_016145 [Oryza meyeriana var. granulata]|uniref:Uncharacterized protein n=1 Tax=Oryza meyeriana var. granulata TaxID=110450 RepID=A0A6G1F8H6_9ORYZ|nr:hypothetical protein E2562_016145 [Oryza meyeriana var. granulata]